MSEPISWADFERVELRVGTVVAVEEFPEARKPAWKLTVDFGPGIGTRRSSAQITVHYTRDDLLGRQVLAVLNRPGPPGTAGAERGAAGLGGRGRGKGTAACGRQRPVASPAFPLPFSRFPGVSVDFPVLCPPTSTPTRTSSTAS